MGTLLVLWLACGVLAGFIGASKGKAPQAMLTGFVLGPLGVLAVCFWKDSSPGAVSARIRR